MNIIILISLSLLAVSTASLRAAEARENWTKNCMQCHGSTGAADTKMGKKLDAKNLTDPKVQASFTDADAAKAIKEGMKENGKTVMKPFGDKLSDDEIKALVTYVRSLKK
jgi:mono/diheme cytochrome c family protein